MFLIPPVKNKERPGTNFRAWLVQVEKRGGKGPGDNSGE